MNQHKKKNTQWKNIVEKIASENTKILPHLVAAVVAAGLAEDT